MEYFSTFSCWCRGTIRIFCRSQDSDSIKHFHILYLTQFSFWERNHKKLAKIRRWEASLGPSNSSPIFLWNSFLFPSLHKTCCYEIFVSFPKRRQIIAYSKAFQAAHISNHKNHRRNSPTKRKPRQIIEIIEIFEIINIIEIIEIIEIINIIESIDSGGCLSWLAVEYV